MEPEPEPPKKVPAPQHCGSTYGNSTQSAYGPSYKKAFAETALASKALTATAPSHSNIIQVKNNKSIL